MTSREYQDESLPIPTPIEVEDGLRQNRKIESEFTDLQEVDELLVKADVHKIEITDEVINTKTAFREK